MKRYIAGAVIMAAVLMGFSCMGARGEDQILDKPLDHFYDVGLSYIPSSRFEGYGKTDMLQLDADWAFGYLENFGGGNIDLNLVIQNIIFLDSAGLKLPNQVGKVVLDAGFALRNSSGTAVQIRLLPGIYSDFEKIDGDSFYLPVSCAVIKTFDPSFSGILGLQVRPGFRRVLMPIIGVAWEITEDLRLEVGLPHSRFRWAITPELSTHVGLDWDNTSFTLNGPEDEHGDQITLEDFRAYWGMLYKVSDNLQISGELGTIFNRSVQFEQNPAEAVDIETSPYVKFAVGSPF